MRRGIQEAGVSVVIETLLQPIALQIIATTWGKDCVEISIRRMNVAILRRTGKAREKGPLGGCEFWVQWMTQETRKIPGN